jgi:hypothetical protein
MNPYGEFISVFYPQALINLEVYDYSGSQVCEVRDCRGGFSQKFCPVRDLSIETRPQMCRIHTRIVIFFRERNPDSL